MSDPVENWLGKLYHLFCVSRYIVGYNQKDRSYDLLLIAINLTFLVQQSGYHLLLKKDLLVIFLQNSKRDRLYQHINK